MREPFSDEQLKQALMQLMREHYPRFNNAIRYDKAWVKPNVVARSIEDMEYVRKENNLLENERKMWSARIRSIYNSIEGFAGKPAIKITRTPHGDCFIQLSK